MKRRQTARILPLSFLGFLGFTTNCGAKDVSRYIVENAPVIGASGFRVQELPENRVRALFAPDVAETNRALALLCQSEDCRC